MAADHLPEQLGVVRFAGLAAIPWRNGRVRVSRQDHVPVGVAEPEGSDPDLR